MLSRLSTSDVERDTIAHALFDALYEFDCCGSTVRHDVLASNIFLQLEDVVQVFFLEEDIIPITSPTQLNLAMKTLVEITKTHPGEVGSSSLDKILDDVISGAYSTPAAVVTSILAAIDY